MCQETCKTLAVRTWKSSQLSVPPTFRNIMTIILYSHGVFSDQRPDTPSDSPRQEPPEFPVR